MHCINCGEALPDNAKFCPGCGTAITAAEKPLGVARTPGYTGIPSQPPRQIPSSSVQSKPSGSYTGLLGGCAAIIVFFIVVTAIVNSCSHSQENSANSSDGNVANVSTSTQPPTESPQQQKRDFLRNVDESISGARIAGNPYKFVGDDVDLHGTIVNVLDDSHFNMSTGDVESGDYAVILVETNEGVASDLEANQAIRVIGTVEEPTEGTNAMGGAGEFPTVKAKFME